MDLTEALYTTRAMRRVKPDPIPTDVQARIVDAAIRAPTGGNAQNWRFLLVDDHERIEQIAPLYKAGIDMLWTTIYAEQVAWAAEDPEDPERAQFLRVQRSASWAADHFATYPLLLFGFAQHDPTGGSIYPALWSAQLAARGEGVGSALTVVLLFHNDDGVRDPRHSGRRGMEHGRLRAVRLSDRDVGRGGPPPAHEVTYRNRWGEPPGFEIPEPLWPVD